MPVDRAIWAEKFRTKLPNWPCPTCKKGHYSTRSEKLWTEETGPSLDAHSHEAWDPDWIEQRFVGLLQCGLPACREIASISGSSQIDHYQTDWDEFETEQIYTVVYISPAPIPISIPDQTPDQIVEAVGRASALIWSSSDSAANQLRQAIEALMDDAGIAASDANGKRIFLHNRIVEFQLGDKENGDVLLATKWLGNSGSHVGTINRDHVLDAFDMIEFVLYNRYGTAKAELLAKVAAVNAAKGPVTPP